jgi:hypothetical protein
MRKSVFVWFILLSFLKIHAQNLNYGYQKLCESQFFTRPALIDVENVFKQYANSTFERTYEKESPTGKHVLYQQIYANYPVFNATLKINYTRSGECTSILSTALKNIQPVTYNFAQKELATKNIPAIEHKNLTYTVTEGFLPLSDSTLVPVFRIDFRADGFGETYYVHAQDLTILQKIDNRVFFTHKTYSDTTGLVFYPDPLTSSGNTYGSCGSPCMDNSDANNSFLEGQRKEVKLKGLTYNNIIHKFELKGPYIEILDLGIPVDTLAQSSTGKFNYTRNQQGFEQTNAYYFIDRMQRYVQCLGFMNIGNRPVRVDAHYGGADNSFYLLPSVTGTAGDIHFGTGGVDDAEDMDVIIHEYGHALSNEASPNSNSGSQRMAIDEAIGDYFASSVSRAMYPYSAWYNVFNWDGHNTFWSGRVTNSNKKYPDNITGNIYADAPIFSSALMDIHTDLGASKTDRLVLQMLYGLTTNMTMQEAAMLLIQADCSLFGGAYFNTIKTHLVNRGLVSDTVSAPTGCSITAMSACNFDEVTSVQPHLTKNSTNTLKIYPNPAKSYLFIEGIKSQKNCVLHITNLMGQIVFEQPISNSQNGMQIHFNLPNGMYFVQCCDDKQGFYAPLIVE